MNSLVRNTLATVAFAALCAASVAQGQEAAAPAQAGPPELAKQLLTARGGSMRVTSSAWVSGDALPERYTQNGENVSPAITWTKGPPGTVAYAVLAEDNGVARPEPITHWIVYDLPSTLTRLPMGVTAGQRLENGGAQGKNIRGENGYIGPKPPAGQTHPYHFQVFALSSRLNIDPATADRKTVVDAMKGKVLAVGDLIGMYTGK
jgi:Raf kinase inhibitor-like YbhB/YbcL family protein